MGNAGMAALPLRIQKRSADEHRTDLFFLYISKNIGAFAKPLVQLLI